MEMPQGRARLIVALFAEHIEHLVATCYHEEARLYITEMESTCVALRTRRHPPAPQQPRHPGLVGMLLNIGFVPRSWVLWPFQVGQTLEFIRPHYPSADRVTITLETAEDACELACHRGSQPPRESRIG